MNDNDRELLNKMPTGEEKQQFRIKLLAARAGVSLDEAKEKNYSLRQLKRMIAEKEFAGKKLERRQVEKQKRKAKNRARRQQGLAKTAPTIQMKNSSNKMCIAIDMSFNDLMTDKEIRKLSKQIQRCYSINRHSTDPCQLYLTSCSDEFRKRLNQIQPGFESWDINCREESYLDVFKANLESGTLVFLTSDSDTTLPAAGEIVKDNGRFVYVIGGLIDHNAHKGLTRKIADERGLKHAKLPIDEHLQLDPSFSKVLTVNQVFELMLDVSLGIDWPAALQKTIPQRRMQAKPTESKSTDPEASNQSN